MSRTLRLLGGPYDGRTVMVYGSAWVQVPVSPSHDVLNIAIYDAHSGAFVEIRPDQRPPLPPCPACGGRTMRAGASCDKPGCEIVMCVGDMKPECPFAMHSKP